MRTYLVLLALALTLFLASGCRWFRSIGRADKNEWAKQKAKQRARAQKDKAAEHLLPADSTHRRSAEK